MLTLLRGIKHYNFLQIQNTHGSISQRRQKSLKGGMSLLLGGLKANNLIYLPGPIQRVGSRVLCKIME